MYLTIDITAAEPKPQGSKSAFVNKRTGKVAIKEDNPGTKPWRDTVAWAAHEAIMKAGLRFPNKPAITGCVAVNIIFYMHRPKSAKPGTRPGVKPDIDKLLRSTFDALTAARAWEDDSRVVCVAADKIYAGDAHESGAYIILKGVQ